MSFAASVGKAAGLWIVLGTIAGTASAQITTGTVSGTVKDVQGGVIPGASVMLTSETKGTKSVPVVTSETGDFVFPNITADTYTIQVEMPSFKTLKRSGIAVGPGSRVAVGSLTIEVGGTSEVVDVKGEPPVIQATSGERSFTVATDAVANLPLADRNFAALAALAPGVTGTARTGDTASSGGGNTNFMMDGVSLMDTGSNRLLMAVNVESVAEVKVLTSTYQAEYGRSSGLQITAVTKSGTNRLRGSLYDVERHSRWNANSKTNKLNGQAKAISDQRDWGYSAGGPIGKPGGQNRFFFFYAQEFEPRTAGNDVRMFRFPTPQERLGDFSATTDNTGALYPYIRNPGATGTCSATSTTNATSCFNDGGLLGKIPANGLYGLGLNILNQYPLPNCPAACPTWVPTSNYNYQITRPTEHLTGWQPAIRLDYQPSDRLRLTYKFTAFGQPSKIINGTLPGYNDTKLQRPIVSTWGVSGNYNINPSTFLEATYGHSMNTQAGCPLVGGSPNFCASALPMSPAADLRTNGLAGLPFLFPNANIIDPDYYAYRVLNDVQPPSWDGTSFARPPAFSWGNRVSNAPPSIPYPGFLNINVTQDFSVSVTKVAGAHTAKAGFYNSHSYKAENATGADSFGALSFQQDAVGTNPCDTSFGFANAATGCFSSFNQASKYVEGNYVYNNTEAYLQDNWKVSRKLTLDYGMRFVHQQPQYDKLSQAANFLPEKWTAAGAPLLYRAGCVGGANPCSGTNRQAMNPLTSQLLGTNSSLAIGALVPNSGNTMNGLFLPGQGIVEQTYIWPALAFAPRFGLAYDVTGAQRLVLRGGAGLFYDRPSGNTVISMPGNPPASANVTVRYGSLQTLGNGGLTTQGPPALNTFQYNAKLPSSTQWNAGLQMTLPWATSLDVSYVGQHGFNVIRSVNINAVDFGTAFLSENQDPTLATSATPGATAFSTDLLRSFRGYGAISHRVSDGWRTYQSIQLSVNRRFSHGVSFGFNDTLGFYDHANTTPRFQHNADGSYGLRADQAQADKLLGVASPQKHIMKANFVWDLPNLATGTPVLKAVGLVVNDWLLSGIWTGATGSTYTVSASYSSGGGNVNLTGSPDYAARIRIVGDPGKGCSSDLYRQFNTAAFQGPLNGSLGLESGNAYLRGCFSSVLDLAIARTIRLGHGRTMQLRADIFNAPNEGRITARQTSITLTSTLDPVTPQNLPFGTDGVLLPNRVRPNQAGFGAVSGYQGPRTVQGQVRFSF